jgi:hypothetical protein
LVAAECIFLCFGVIMLRDIASLVRHADQVVEKVVLPVQQSSGAIVSGANALAKALPAIAANSAEASRQTALAAEKTGLVMDNVNGLVTDLRGTAAELQRAITDLDGDAATLTKSADAALAATGKTLEQLTGLEVVLRKQLEAGAPEALATLQAMRKLAEDPALDNVLKNVDSATYHGAATIETMDIATRGLRQKVGRVKWVLEHLLGLVKLTFPI